jgi:hypothetical protein
MSDEVMIFGSIFALALLWSSTRIYVARLSRRSAQSLPATTAPAEFAAVSERLRLLEDLAENTAREVQRLADAQQFTDALLANRADVSATLSRGDRATSGN